MKRIFPAILNGHTRLYPVVNTAKSPFKPVLTTVRWKKGGTDESHIVLPPSKTKVYLNNLPNGYTGMKVMQLVQPFGVIESCHKLSGNRIAFVNFESENSAQNAVSALNGTMLANRKLVVQFSTSGNYRKTSNTGKSKEEEHLLKLKNMRDHFGNARHKLLDERFMDLSVIGGSENPQYYTGKGGAYSWQYLLLNKDELENNKNRNNLEDLMYMLHRFGYVSLKCLLKCVVQLEETGIININNAMLILRCTGSLLQDLKASERQIYTERVWKIFEKSVPDIELTVPIFNTLLDVFVANRHEFNGFLFLAKMQTLGLNPDYTTFELLIKSYCMKGDMDSVSKLIDYLHREDFILTHSVFHMLIIGNFKDNNEGAALQILDIMREQGLQPDFSTYCILMTCFSEKGNMDGLNWVIQEMENRDMPIKSYVLFDCIHKLIVNGHDQHVLSILHLLNFDDKYYYKDAIAVIKTLIHEGFEKQAYLLYLNFFIESNHHKEKEELQGRFILKPLVLNSEFDVIRSIICDLKERGESRVISETARVAITAKKLDLAFQLLQLMGERGEPVRHHMFYPILKILSKDQDISNILITFGRIRDLAIDFTPSVILSNLILFVFPICDSLNKKDSECIETIEIDSYDREEVCFAYFVYLMTMKDTHRAMQFADCNKMKVCFPLLLHIKDLSDLQWEELLQVLKACDDISGQEENQIYGNILQLIITDHEKHKEKVLKHFMSLNLKLKKDDADKICQQFKIQDNLVKKLKASHVYGS